MRMILAGLLIALCSCGNGETAKTDAATGDFDVLITTSGTLTGLLVDLHADSIRFRSADGVEARVPRNEARTADPPQSSYHSLC